MLNNSEKALIMTAVTEKIMQYKREYRGMTGNAAADYKEFLDDQIKTAKAMFEKLQISELIETEQGFKFRA